MKITTTHRYRGTLPEIKHIYPPELAMPSDAQWLRDNPEAIARVRTFLDAIRREKRVLLLAVRLADATSPDGFQVSYFEAHFAHLGGAPFKAWQDQPTVLNANNLALSVLTADADADGGHAWTVLKHLVLPDLSELSDQWRADFAPPEADTGGSPRPSLQQYPQTGEPKHV